MHSHYTCKQQSVAQEIYSIGSLNRMPNRSPAETHKKRWKDHLLRSGVPLEHEVARLLVENGLSVRADYSFNRRDSDGTKEWSTDISASWMDSRRNGELTTELALLIECKHRTQEKALLFITDPNTDDFSPIVPGYTLRPLDFYASHFVDTSPMRALEVSYPFVYKGIEVHDAGAFEDDFRHGIQQLRYATPALLRQTIDFGMTGDLSETVVPYFAKILVTNARILLMKTGVSIEAIRSAETIDEIASPVDSLIYYSDYGPDYEDHFRSIFSHESEERMSLAKYVRDRIQASGREVTGQSDPVSVIEGFMMARRYECMQLSTQFFVTSPEGLGDILTGMKRACRTSFRKRTKRPAWKIKRRR